MHDYLRREKKFIDTLVRRFGNFYEKVFINLDYVGDFGEGEVDVMGILPGGEVHIYEVKASRCRNGSALIKARDQLSRASRHFQTPYCAIYVGNEDTVIPVFIED